VQKKATSLQKQRTARANADDYEHGEEQFSSAAAVYRKEDATHRTFELAASRGFCRCLTQLINKEVKKAVEDKGFDVKTEAGTVTGMNSYGDESTDYGMKITSKGSASVDYFADFVFVRLGRSLGFYAHVSDKEDSTCGEFSSDDCVSFDGLITSATDRLTTATGGEPTTDASQSSTTAVKAAENATQGTIVVDSNGKTVYNAHEQRPTGAVHGRVSVGLARRPAARLGDDGYRLGREQRQHDHDRRRAAGHDRRRTRLHLLR
jgi:hypothetical protein